jgi:DHA1 family multidrug resistance protein-like MFS transporter
MALRRLRQDIATGWKRTLYVMFVTQLITAIGFSSIFPFLPLYVEELGAATSLSVELLAGLVFSAQALTMAIASPIWGMLADRHGRKLMVERAMFGGAVILLLMAFVRSAEELVLLRALQGLITGTVGAASALVASVTPRERTGYAMGLLQVGLGSGLALGPLIGGVVADAVGYYAAFYVTAALLFIAGLLVLLGVEENFVPADSPDGESGGLIDEWRHILSATGVLITYGLRFSVQLGRMMIVPIAPLFVQMLLGDSAHVNTFTVVASAAATTTLSAVYLGRLGDRIGHRRILMLTMLLAALLYLPQSLVTQAWQLLALQALVGVAMGGIVPAISALLARYTREGEEGAVYGLDNSINSGARAAAPLLGAAVAVWFGLRATFAATALILLGAGLLAARGLPRPARPRQAGSARAL